MKQIFVTIWKMRALILALCFIGASHDKVSADIFNPAIPTALGGASGSSAAAASGSYTTYYAAILWRASITVGMMLVLIYFLWGAIEWITASGEDGKIKTARNKMTGAVTGMVLLAGSFSIIAMIGNILGLDLLNPVLPTP